MVYEANARTRNQVYGCTGSICQLLEQVNELQAELINIQTQEANLIASISNPPIIETDDDFPFFIGDNNHNFMLDSL